MNTYLLCIANRILCNINKGMYTHTNLRIEKKNLGSGCPQNEQVAMGSIVPLKARSHGTFFCECDCDKNGLCGCQRLFIWCDCDAFVCAMSHMNGYHTHSVRLRCAISICIYTDHSHTV